MHARREQESSEGEKRRRGECGEKQHECMNVTQREIDIECTYPLSFRKNISSLLTSALACN